PDGLFGYRQVPQDNITLVPQWWRALERHLSDRLEEKGCDGRAPEGCHRAEWTARLDELDGEPVQSQLDAVNRYANTRPYLFDWDLYGVEDYWAVPREFLYDGGDCEDYVITKYFSLRRLGFDHEDLRIVVVQDTNLRVPHAVLAVRQGSSMLILDNQVQAVMPDTEVVHYAPVYSINEQSWWLHLPR